MRARRRHRTSRQRGAALLVGLLLLIVATLLALLGARLAWLQERAVGAQRVAVGGFEQAEGALVAARQWLLAQAPASLCAGNGGPITWARDEALAARFVSTDAWPASLGQPFALALPDVPTGQRPARAWIDVVAYVPDDATMPAAPIATRLACATPRPDGVAYFRITARGVGPGTSDDASPPGDTAVQAIVAIRLAGAATPDDPPTAWLGWRELP